MHLVAGTDDGQDRVGTGTVPNRTLARDFDPRALGLAPVEVRRINLIGPGDLPYTAATRLVHDSPSYPACFEKAVARRAFSRVLRKTVRVDPGLTRLYT